MQFSLFFWLILSQDQFFTYLCILLHISYLLRSLSTFFAFRCVQMVHLPDFVCFQCNQPALPFSLKGQNAISTKKCTYCGRFTCGKCVRRNSQAPIRSIRCTGTETYCDLSDRETVPILTYFYKFAPEDEMKLLKDCKWNPCQKCSSKQTCNETEKMYCQKCRSHPKKWDPKLFPYQKVIHDLTNLLNADQASMTKNPLPESKMECWKCNEETGHKRFMNEGMLICDYCCYGIKPFYFEHTLCAYYFRTFVDYVYDSDDLKLLTYSKWTPLKCEHCEVVLSEAEGAYPGFARNLCKIVCEKCGKKVCGPVEAQNFIRLYFLMEIIREFRGYFKDAGIDITYRETETETPIPECSLESNYNFERLCEDTGKLTITIPDTPR